MTAAATPEMKMRETLAEISASAATLYATIATVIGSVIAGLFVWLRHRDTNETTVRQNRITANRELIQQALARIEDLEKRDRQKDETITRLHAEIAQLHAQLLELARENERLKEENKHLRADEDRVEKVRGEKHAIANRLNTLELTIVYLKGELNKVDEAAGRAPRFKRPNTPDLEESE